MKAVEIMMPMRKRPEDVTPDERQKFMTWIEEAYVPESMKEAIQIMLRDENAERQAAYGEA